MSSRGFQKHDLIKLTASDYEWASTTYTRVALTAGSASPDGLGLDTDIVATVEDTTVTNGTVTVSYIIPTVFDAVSIIDGIIESTFNLYVGLTGTVLVEYYATISKLEMTIKAIDTDGSSRDLVANHEVWSGTLTITGKTTPSSSTKQLIVWTDVSDSIVDASERIVVDLKFTYSGYTLVAGPHAQVGLDVTAGTDATTISLPFVM